MSKWTWITCTALLVASACDEDARPEEELAVDVEHDDADDRQAREDAPTVDEEPGLSEDAVPIEELAAPSQPAESPAGTCCWAHCGGTGMYEPLWGVVADCNHHAWQFCAAKYGTSLIDAEWWSC